MKKFRTLRGFLKGEEPEENVIFNYSATLRIWGDIPDLDNITCTLILQPTRTRRKGEVTHVKAAPSEHDMWSYTVPIPEAEPLEKHIDALWTRIRDHTAFARRTFSDYNYAVCQR
jgi:hypothetical protein